MSLFCHVDYSEPRERSFSFALLPLRSSPIQKKLEFRFENAIGPDEPLLLEFAPFFGPPADFWPLPRWKQPVCRR